MWNETLPVWEKAISEYPLALLHRESQSNKSKLRSLDKYVWEELPEDIRSRNPNNLTTAEYSKLIRWKLKRGKWRPRLLGFANALTDSQVETASTKAFELLKKEDRRGALDRFCELRGCGPATASAFLALMDQSVPFMGDEILVLTQGPKKSYTAKAFEQLVKDVAQKATELSELDEGRTWTSRDVERAVFSNEQLRDVSPDEIGRLQQEADTTNIETNEKADAGESQAGYGYQSKVMGNSKKGKESSRRRAAKKDEITSVPNDIEEDDSAAGNRRSKRLRTVADGPATRRTSSRKKRKVT